MPTFSIFDDAGKPRLVAVHRLDAERDFDAVAAELIKRGGKLLKARKIAYVAARAAAAGEQVETRFNGKETQNTAAAGDFVVTNLDARRVLLRDREGAVNSYVVGREAFARLYDRDQGSTAYGAVYKAKGVVDAVEVGGGFDIVAPWGERQHGANGYLVRNGADVYGIQAEAFLATYEIVS